MESKYANDFTRKLHDERQSRIQQVYKTLAESDEGLCAKDISVLLNVGSEAVRRYLKELLSRDLIYVSGRDGKTRLFKANMSPKNLTEEESKTKVEEALPVSPDGKEFEPGSFIPCGDVCKPGDIVWVSSRSGEGQFFRYLVITPWERKATVLGIFPEGHPNLNLNDPNCVYLGNDPETGEGLYADVTNNCSRGYKQFGERLMHVDKDCMDAVKNRLARVMQIDICKKSESEETELMRKEIGSLTAENAQLKAECKGRDNKISEQFKRIQSLETYNEELTKIRNELRDRLEAQNTTIDRLTSENADLRQQLLDVPVAEPETSKEDLDFQVALLNANAELQKELKDRYKDEITTLRQIIFSMIKGGAN